MARRKNVEGTPAPEEQPVDSAGKVRLFADVDEAVAIELAVAAARKRMKKSHLLAEIITSYVTEEQ